jgi:hypothetical protein
MFCTPAPLNAFNRVFLAVLTTTKGGIMPDEKNRETEQAALLQRCLFILDHDHLTVDIRHIDLAKQRNQLVKELKLHLRSKE